MIRPFTCLAVLLACGSGLYLYQSKHRVKVLDDQIAQTVKSTDALREQTRMLSAEWTLLNDPERLRQLANQFLTLQTVSPNQFTSLAGLDSRLPPPVAPGPPADAGTGTLPPTAAVPVASDDSGRAGEAAGNPADAKLAELPSPDATKDAASASPSAASAQSSRTAMAGSVDAAHPVDHKAPVPRLTQSQPRFAAAEQHAPEPRGPAQRGIDARSAEQRLAEARPMVPAPRARLPARMPQSGGSLLGMASSMAAPPAPLPLPRPMPVSAPQMSYGAGG